MAQPQDGANMMPGVERRGMLGPDRSYNTAQNYPISKPTTGHTTSNQDDTFMKGNDTVTSPSSDPRNQTSNLGFPLVLEEGTEKGRGSASKKVTAPEGVAAASISKPSRDFAPAYVQTIPKPQDRIRRRGTCCRPPLKGSYARRRRMATSAA